MIPESHRTRKLRDKLSKSNKSISDVLENTDSKDQKWWDTVWPKMLDARDSLQEEVWESETRDREDYFLFIKKCSK